MPRIGQNPMKWVSDLHHPKPITITTIVHIPSLAGYWSESLDVLKLCLTSMRESTKMEFDLFVFDNNSCSAVKEYLYDEYRDGKIQFLLLSDMNLGKVGAWNILFTAAPGDVVAYMDSDVYFLTGWLEESLKVLEAFPKAGMITASPYAGGDISTLHTSKDASKDPSIEMQTGKIIPDQYLIAYLKGLGRYPDQYEASQISRNDVLLSSKGIRAYATASHFQFLTKKEIVMSIFPVQTNMPIGNASQFDKGIEARGLWRLSTENYHVHHMGNRVPDLVDELPWRREEISNEFIKSRTAVSTKMGNKSRSYGLMTNPFLRRVIKMIHVLTYRWLYGK